MDDQMTAPLRRLSQAIMTGSQRDGLAPVALHFEPYGHTEAFNIYVYGDAFAPLSSGQRYVKVLDWIKAAGDDLRRYVATVLVLTHQELQTIENQAPASGTVIGFGNERFSPLSD